VDKVVKHSYIIICSYMVEGS